MNIVLRSAGMVSERRHHIEVPARAAYDIYPLWTPLHRGSAYGCRANAKLPVPTSPRPVTHAGDQFAGNQSRADGFAQTNVVGEQGDGQAAAERDEVGNLVMPSLQPQSNLGIAPGAPWNTLTVRLALSPSGSACRPTGRRLPN